MQSRNLEEENARLRRALKQKDEKIEALTSELQWVYGVIANPAADAESKTVYLATADEMKRGTPREDGKVRTYQTNVARRCALSVQTVSNRWTLLSESGWLERDSNRQKDAETGKISTDVFFDLPQQAKINPEGLTLIKERKQGGKRVKCPSCHSFNVFDVEDKHTYRVCECGHVLKDNKSTHKVTPVNEEDEAVEYVHPIEGDMRTEGIIYPLLRRKRDIA